MTITQPSKRLRANSEGRPTAGSTRIDAILALIDRVLAEASSTPAPAAELTVLDGAGRRTPGSIGAFEQGTPSRKEVA